jgi:hypothetical protein
MWYFEGMHIYLNYLSCKVPLARIFHPRYLQAYFKLKPHASFYTLLSSLGREQYFLHPPDTYVTKALSLL